MLIELKPRVVCGADWGLARRSRPLRSAVGGASRRRSGSVSFKISLVEQGPHAAFQCRERSSPPEHHLATARQGSAWRFCPYCKQMRHGLGRALWRSVCRWKRRCLVTGWGVKEAREVLANAVDWHLELVLKYSPEGRDVAAVLWQAHDVWGTA